MNLFQRQIGNREQLSEFLFQFGSMMIIPGFLYSKALITISIVSILLAGLLQVNLEKIKSFGRNYEYALYTLVFIGIAISGFNSANTSQWLKAINIKLPFILLPLGFYLVARLNINKTINIHLWLLAVLTISAIPQFLYIAQHHKALIDSLGRGQPINTPVEHVKYSMMNAYGVVSAGYLLLYRYKEVSKWKILIAVGIIIVTVLMHLLAVRTGLVILYTSVFILGLTYAIQRGSKTIWIGLFSISLLAPVIAYKTVPMIHQKVNYMMHDWKMHKAGVGQNYADSQRWTMAKAGIDIWKQNPILGIGHGDLRDESYKHYNDVLNIKNLAKLPHNQFLITLMSGGIIGLLIFLIGFYGPLWRHQGEFTFLLGLLYLNYTLSFFVENSLERSVSVGFFLFFSLLLISTRTSK